MRPRRETPGEWTRNDRTSGIPESENSSVTGASCSIRRPSDRPAFQLHGRSRIVCVRAAFQACERAHAALPDRRTDLTAKETRPCPGRLWTRVYAFGGIRSVIAVYCAGRCVQPQHIDYSSPSQNSRSPIRSPDFGICDGGGARSAGRARWRGGVSCGPLRRRMNFSRNLGEEAMKKASGKKLFSQPSVAIRKQ